MKLFSNSTQAKPITWGRWIRLNVVLLVLVFLVSLSFPVSTLSQKLNDFFFRLRRPLPTSSQVAMVLIDDASLAEHGRWPWPRAELAKLIRAVSAQQPKAIGVDILLPEAEDEANDSALTSAIQAAPNIVLAAKISTSPTGNLWIDPLSRFANAAKGVGHVQATIDFDGLCRSIPTQEPTADGPRPAFALKLAALIQPQVAPAVSGLNASGIERIASLPLLIDYRPQFEPGAANPPFLVVSAADLLAGKSTEPLAGKAVLIGFGSIDISDRLITPVSNQLPMPGVEINANVGDMVLSGRMLSQVGLLGQLLLVVLMSIVALWVVVRYPGIRGLLVLIGMLAGGYLAAYFLFRDFHRLVSYGPLLVAGVLAAPIAQLENLLIVDREVTSRLQQLRQAISPHYGHLKPAQPDSDLTRWPASDRLLWKLAALKDLQAELSSLYSFNQTLLETMSEGLAVYGADGALVFSNETWKKFCTRQDVVMDKLSNVAQLAGGWRALADLPAEAASWTESEVVLDEELWLFHAVRLPWTSFAEAGALLLIAEDITARRQRDQARSEALSFVTHELRTPLISIQGFSELLMRYPNSPATREAPSTIFRETNRLVAMINTYLEVLRLDAGARPLRLARASVRAIVEHVEKVVQPLAASAKVAVRVEIDSDDNFVFCDETLISGALLNLVSNAIKYGESGTEVLVRVSSSEQEVQFEVQNSGPVIPENELEQLFERFYRPARSESIPGWGLGLSFVRRISQQHGGRVQVTSNQSSGTTFAFTLPRGTYEVSEVTP
ncbi:MAG TPA: CHASE2 domain-containing protein [Candidatus Angelobacter sp.]|jgi:signal transduction histidine kinase/CHASE2 domain-containing sensor protein